MLKKAKKGFTIVELVIVIAVIGILSAILIPTFANLTTQAQQTALRSNLANAYSMYASEAAKGYIGTDEDKIEFKEQAKVYLVPVTSSDLKGYNYDGVKNEWKIDLEAVPGGAKLVSTVTKTGTNLSDEEAKANSKFSDYYFYFVA